MYIYLEEAQKWLREEAPEELQEEEQQQDEAHQEEAPEDKTKISLEKKFASKNRRYLK